MAPTSFYGSGFPYKKKKKLPGKLIVLEGTDGVGRSTQVEILKKYLNTIEERIKEKIVHLTTEI